MLTAKRGAQRAGHEPGPIQEELGFLWARITGRLAASRLRGLRLAVSAVLPGGGATSVACELAVFLAGHRKRVALVETNMRRPCLARRFHVPRSPGLWELMEGTAAIEEIPCCPSRPELLLVGAGQVPPDYDTEFSDELLDQVIGALGSRTDVVVLDLPPLNTSPEAVLITRHVDAAILVVRAHQTRRDDVRRALKTMRAMEVFVAGTVLNDFQYDLPPFLERML